MDSETHICRISFSFNGVVPPGKVLIAPIALDTSTAPLCTGATFSSIEDVVEVATSEENAPASQQSTAANAGKQEKVPRRMKKAKLDDASSSLADGSSHTAKKAKVDRSEGTLMPGNQSQVPTTARQDCPGRDVNPAVTCNREGSQDKSPQGAVTAVNADDPEQQLKNYDEFVA